jgi:ABC-type phosphate/phosphonate transport system substrate-binding protein
LGRTDVITPRSRRARAWLLSTAAAIAALVLIGLCVPGLSGRSRGTLWAYAASGAAPGGRVLKVACLGTGRERLPRELELQAERLAKHLQPVGIAAIEVVPLASYEQLRAGFQEGELDVFLGSAHPGTRLAQELDAKIILERARVGEDDGRALWVVSALSKARASSDLKGQRVAFVDRFSTTRALEALQVLLGEGLELVREGRDGEGARRADAVRFLFSGDVESSLLLLHRGRVDAVALDGSDVSAADIGPDGTLRVIGRSSVLAPRDVIVSRRGLDPPIAEALEEELGRQSAFDPTGVLRFEPPSPALLAEIAPRLARWAPLHARLAP